MKSADIIPGHKYFGHSCTCNPGERRVLNVFDGPGGHCKIVSYLHDGDSEYRTPRRCKLSTFVSWAKKDITDGH